jgi:hypothetical protein
MFLLQLTFCITAAGTALVGYTQDAVLWDQVRCAFLLALPKRARINRPD